MLIEDTGYPHDPEAIRVIPEAVTAVAAARRAGFVAGIVSNQSGVGRGLFGWPAFAAVQAAIDDVLGAAGATLDFVLACPHHPEAALPQLRSDHGWRKPRPGMLLAARDALGLDMARSIMIGDRASDMEAAAAAGVDCRLQIGPASGTPIPTQSGLAVARSGLADAVRPLLVRGAARYKGT